jgi:Ala-tRNA(Pro) deacylase
MTDDVIGTGTHQQLITLLTEQGARFRVMEHEAVGKCEVKYAGPICVRAQSLVCKVKGNGVKKHVLAILAADLQADLSHCQPFRRA